MNGNQRKRILKNIDSLVNHTDFDELCQAGLNDHLLSATMIHTICRYEPRNISGDNHNYDEDEIKRERHKQLFIKITKRGPEAFEKLRRIFISLKYKEALKILFDGDNGMISISRSKNTGTPTCRIEDINRGSVPENNIADSKSLVSITREINNDVSLHEYEGLIQPKSTVFVRKAASIIIDPKIGTYPMESKNNRGIFFMVSSNQQLDEDAQTLLSLFQQLGFKIYAYSNIMLEKFFELLEELLGSDKINDIECFVLALRTSGRVIDGVQRMTFQNGAVVKVGQIQKHFYHYKCKALMGKPKIFIYPYSETPNRDVKSSRRVKTDCIGRVGRSKHTKQVVQLSDVINCYATTKGFMDDRDNDNYSRYIQHFVNVVAERAYYTHFENMLKLIQNNVAKSSITSSHLQMASYDNISFNKILYFNPGK